MDDEGGVERHPGSVLDDADLTDAVRSLLADDRASVLSVRTETVPGGLGAGTRVDRLAGEAVIGRRPPVRWSLIVKRLSRDGPDFLATGDDPARWDYWRREWHAYRSDWQQRLTGPVRAARCLATSSPADPGRAWMAIEDLGRHPRRTWSVARFAAAATALGAFNAGQLGADPGSDDHWFSHHWLRGWVEQSAAFTQRLDEAVRHRVAGRIFTAPIAEDLLLAWDQRGAMVAALDALPTTIGHNDAFPRNLFESRTGLVAIDWAFCGPAPVGQELSALVGGSQVFRHCPPRRWVAMEQACLAGYLAGLAEAGGVTEQQVRTGYLLSTALRFGPGTLAPALGLTLSGGHRALIEAAFGCSYETFVTNTAAAVRFHLRTVARARQLLGLRGS